MQDNLLCLEKQQKEEWQYENTDKSEPRSVPLCLQVCLLSTEHMNKKNDYLGLNQKKTIKRKNCKAAFRQNQVIWRKCRFSHLFE